MPEESTQKKSLQEEKKSKSTKKGLFNSSPLIKWAGIMVIVLVISYFMVEKVLTPMFLSPKSEKPKPPPVDIKKKIGPIYNFEPIIVNLNEEGARRYLKVSLSLELSNTKVIKEIDLLKPRLLDSLITLLSSKSLKDIEDVKGKENLRREIVFKFNRQLNTGRVVNVYFGEFMIQ